MDDIDLKTGHVLFVDIIEFSRLKMDEQLKTIDELEKHVRSCEKVKQFRHMEDMIFLPTGDGFALAFLDNPTSPLDTALELADKIKDSIPCRMGIDIGPVIMREDINLHINITGGGINLAQRVMDFGGKGHILASDRVKNWLSQVSKEYEEMFSALGTYTAKHGVEVELYNVMGRGVGKPEPPVKGKKEEAAVIENRKIKGHDDQLIAPRKGYFIGREKEVDSIVSFIEGGEKLGVVTASEDVVNITGGPGIGKTELCKAALRKWLEKGGGPAWFTSLAGAEDIFGFLSCLTEAYVVPEPATQDMVLGAISQNPGVLYLDNLESVLNDKEAVGILEMLTNVPNVKVLASSRELPEGLGKDIPVSTLDTDSAVALFINYCKRAGRVFEDSPELREFIEEVLGCHPLSIVLVASHSQAYPSVKLIREAWKDVGTRLASARGTGGRLTSLEVSISASLEAVSKENEQAVLLWGLMTFFPDGMSDYALDYFIRNSGIDRNAYELMVRLNLLERKDEGALMLPPLRRYAEGMANDKQGGFDMDALIKNVYDYFLNVAKEADEHQFDERHIETLDRVLAEFPNLHRFFIVACEGKKELAVKLSVLGGHLSNFYQLRLLLGIDMLERLLPLQKGKGLKVESANRLKSLGDLELRIGKLAEAEGRYKEAIELYKKERADLGLANALRGLGDLELRIGKVDEAEGRYKEAIELYKKERNDLGLANALKSLGDLEGRLGKVEEAEGRYKAAIELYKKERDDLGLANALQSYGDLHQKQKEFRKAEEKYAKARDLYIDERDNMGLAYTCSALARVWHRLDDRAKSGDYIKEALSAAENSNVPPVMDYVKAVEEELRG